MIGITLVGAATLRFRRRVGAGFRRASIELAPRPAYLLSGEVREQWEHGIAAHAGLRYSITFLTLQERGKQSPGRSKPDKRHGL